MLNFITTLHFLIGYTVGCIVGFAACYIGFAMARVKISEMIK